MDPEVQTVQWREGDGNAKNTYHTTGGTVPRLTALVSAVTAVESGGAQVYGEEHSGGRIHCHTL
jgi:hypothetical protein